MDWSYSLARQTALTEHEYSSWLLHESSWWGTADASDLELVARMATLADSRSNEIPFMYPRLLIPERVSALTLSRHLTKKEGAIVERIANLSVKVHDDPLEFWQVGLGPLERALIRMSDGLIRLSGAESEVVPAGARGDVINPYVRAICRPFVYAGSDTRAGPVLGSILICRAAEASTQADNWATWSLAVDAFIHCAKVSLSHVHDPYLYRFMRCQVAKYLAQAERKSQTSFANAQQLLGALLVEMYSAHVAMVPGGDMSRAVLHAAEMREARYVEAEVTFLQQAVEVYPAGDDGTADFDFPDPETALSEGIALLRSALAHIDSPVFALTSIALGLHTLHALGTGVSKAEVIKACDDALGVIDENDISRQSEIRGVRRFHAPSEQMSKTASPTEAEPPYANDAHALRSVLQSLDGSLEQQREKLASLEKAIVEKRDDDLLQFFLIKQGEVLGVEQLRRVPPEDSLSRRAANLAEISKTEQWSPEEYAAGLMALAARALNSNEELVGLDLLDLARTVSPPPNDSAARVDAFLTAYLTFGQACNYGQSGQLVEAVVWYAVAARKYACIDLRGEALRCLKRVYENAWSSHAAARAAIWHLSTWASILELMVGAAAVPLENRIRLVSCGSSGCQAARAYSLSRPPRTGFRWIRSRSRPVTVLRPPSCSPSGTRWAMPWCGRAVL